MVNAQEQIERFREFIEKNYQKQIHELIRTGKRALIINFNDLAQFDIELSHELLDEPEETLQAAKIALEQTEIEDKESLKVRFSNLPNSQRVRIRDVRSEHLGKFLTVEGIVRQSSDVRPQVISAKFECPSCGNRITIPQIEQKFKEPGYCTCGRRGRFRLVQKTLVDVQRLMLEETPESMEGGEHQKRLALYLKEDLVEPKMEKRTTPGTKIKAQGIIKEIPIPAKTGGQLTRYDLVMEVNFIELLEELYEDIVITKEDEIKIQQLAKDPTIVQKFINSIAPSIYGHEDVKGALLLQLMSGVRKEKGDGTVTRGDIHMLLVGDPGVAKSTMLTFIAKASPKSRYVAGRGATSAGITATVVKDEFLRGFALEAGAIVLANNGLLCLHPETEVVVNNESKKIHELFDEKKVLRGKQGEDIVEYHSLTKSVPTLDRETITINSTKATKIRRKWYKGKLKILHLQSGFSLKITPDHLLLDGDTIDWKKADQFIKNTRLIAPLKLPSHGQELYFIDLLPDDWKVFLTKKEKKTIKNWAEKKWKTISSFNQKFGLQNFHFLDWVSGESNCSVKQLKEILYHFNKHDKWKKRPLQFGRKKHAEKRWKIVKVTPELGYILGFLYGDGSIGVSSRRTNIGLVQSVKHRSYIQQYDKCWNTIFQKPMARKCVTLKGNIRGRRFSSKSFTFHHGSRLLGELFEVVLGKDLSNIMSLDDNCLKAFIAGVMDSDGCISTKKNKEYRVQHVDFMFAPANKQANLNFILALRRLDCYGKIIIQKKHSPKKYFLVEITGRTDVSVLKKEIEHYSIKAQKTTILNTRRNISSISQKLPAEKVSLICKRIASSTKKTILLNKGIWSTIYRYKEKQIQPARDQLLKFQKLLPLQNEINREINTLVKRDYFLDKIVGIDEEDYEGYVYDLYVPETHNFVANGVIVHNCIDEMDKMSVEDTSALHEAMEQQQVTITKANIQATLTARTTVLAAANPKLGRFDPYQPIAAQIDMPPTLINRFDLIFPFRDIPNREMDDKIATQILEKNINPQEPDIPVELLRKYIAFVKQNIFPKLTQSAIDEIRKFYVGLRNAESPTMSGDMGVKPIPISARQLEALVRLSEAAARVRLSQKVMATDARRAISILKNCLMQVGFDPETGQIDIDRISTGVPASTRNKILLVREIIKELEARGKKTIPFEDVLAEAAEKNLTESQVEEIIEKLKREGEVYEPKRGWIARL